MRSGAILLVALSCLDVGCASAPRFVDVGLERTIFPGLEETGPNGIAGAFERKSEIRVPASAGLIWLTENSDDGDADAARRHFTEYERTGVLQAALLSLRKPPLANVGALPTVAASLSRRNDEKAAKPVESIRNACAQFQYDIALILQTGIAEDAGYNFLAVGYLPIVTSPLFPGNDRAVAVSAELIAIDVRTGMPLACGRGRAADRNRFMFFWQDKERSRELVEGSLARAIDGAAQDLLSQLAGRFGKP